MKQVAIMMVGVPGAGKSTKIQDFIKMYDAKAFASDAIRAELYGDESIQGDPKEVFRVLEERLFEALAAGENVIYDATNIRWKNRKAFVDKVRKTCDARCYLAIMATAPDACKSRNAGRERQVPVGVIDRMIKNFEVPVPAEGWDGINIYRSDFDAVDYFIKNCKVGQQNSHHRFTIFEHCFKAYDYYVMHSDTPDFALNNAALFHDIGKPAAKTFIKKDGTLDTEAHYYGHDNVGGYLSLCHDYEKDEKKQLEIAQLIQYHMMPYFAPKEYTEEQKKEWLYRTMVEKRGFSPEFVAKLELLHEADLVAH